MTNGNKTVILGINPSHNASAAIMLDDEIIAASQEERLSRIKNHIGLPLLSIDYCLKEANISTKEIDYIVIAGKVEAPFFLSTLRDAGMEQPKTLLQLDLLFKVLRYKVLHTVARRIPSVGWLDYFLTLILNRFLAPLLRRKFQKYLVEKTGLDEKKVSYVGHHEAHIATGYFSSGFALDGKSTLGFTLDGGGDGSTSTLWICKGSKIKLISNTIFQTSLGYLYMYTTHFLGLKPIEDEYKVMGLAPYAPKDKVADIVRELEKFIYVDTNELVFKSKYNTNTFYQYMPNLYAYKRFDAIAGAIQELIERRICEWVEAAVLKFNVKRIVTGGGVFANVKVNQKITKLRSVKDISFAPSPGDETNSIGACYLKYSQLSSKKVPKPLKTLYLGPMISQQNLDLFEKSAINKGYTIAKSGNINEKVAQLLADGKIVARVKGRMEFGARALGNRSILADANNLEVRDDINRLIKSRDFWMPFAPTILEHFHQKYVLNKKRLKLPFMMVTLDTTDLGKKVLKAAIHPYDKTARPQILTKDHNEDFYDLILKFSRKTGRFALLNTSFNLHGEPIVCSWKDALHTFAKSGLEYMQVENLLVSK